MSKRCAAILLFDCPEAVEARAINCGSLLGVASATGIAIALGHHLLPTIALCLSKLKREVHKIHRYTVVCLSTGRLKFC